MNLKINHKWNGNGSENAFNIDPKYVHAKSRPLMCLSEINWQAWIEIIIEWASQKNFWNATHIDLKGL